MSKGTINYLDPLGFTVIYAPTIDSSPKPPGMVTIILRRLTDRKFRIT